MSDEQLFIVRATDGQPKRWMYDSSWFELAAGEERIMPLGPAYRAVAHYTVNDNGLPVCTVEAEPYTGQVSLQPVQAAPVYRDEDGQQYDTLAELIAAAKQRGAAEANRKLEPLTLTEADLEALEPADLRELASNRGLTVPANATKPALIKALLAGG